MTASRRPSLELASRLPDRAVLCIALAAVEVAWTLAFTAFAFAAIVTMGVGGACAGWMVARVARRAPG